MLGGVKGQGRLHTGGALSGTVSREEILDVETEKSISKGREEDLGSLGRAAE